MQRFILAEMIKLSQLDVAILVDFIKAHGIRPDWLNMQLPGGKRRALPHRQPRRVREPSAIL
jgi:hypothetical protein